VRQYQPMLIVPLAIIVVALAALPLAMRAYVQRRARDRIYADVGRVPPAPVALVLGAGVQPNGLPTPALRDRVETATALYQAGKVKKLLMTGDNRFANYNEPEAMRKLAVQLGVPDSDIVLDYAGRRTYDSCYRAGESFGARQVIVVTQQFHLARSIYLCEALGVQATGLAADRRAYGLERWWELRELLATTAAWVDVNIRRPVPVLGEKLPIFPS